ncbi:type IX secretion system membrane protein PorP/SprF [Salinibacter grassmerensis]|uniref:type IX secretion system membrane protein PorP/SprF n=1 Tax=Salinibacter grassmerensis TaxID=3040353 RepID=UPI0021E9285A|nr:type IX secretion system membrane protein PorP/SprF [Salinibacter grassmerensis]
MKVEFERWIILCPLLLILGGGVNLSHAQRFISGPSTGLDDAKSALRNPATISFHRPQVALGVKAHHIGISNKSGVPLRQGFLAGSTPFLVADRIGFGGTVRYVDTPIFKKRAFGASVSGRLFRFLSAGVRVSALNLGYNRSEFTEGARNDPLFDEQGTGRTTLTGSVGLFAKPLPNLNLAVGGRNLNRPNLALDPDEEFRADPEIFGGVSYAFNAVRARAEVSNGQYGLDVRLGLEAYSTDGSYIRVGSDAGFNNGRIEGQLHVGGPLSVNYQYNVPTSDLRGPSTGSHQFTVLYEFGRSPELPEMPSSPSLLLEADRSEVDSSPKPRLQVASSHQILQHLEKRIEREIDVPDAALQNVSREALGRLDDNISTDRGRRAGQPTKDVPENIRMMDVLSAEYDSTLSLVGRRVREGTPSTLDILKKDEDSVKAYGLYNRMQSKPGLQGGQVRVTSPTDSVQAFSPQRQELPREESLSVLNPERTTLTLLDPYLPDENGVWTLTIKNEAGEVIRSFDGSGRPTRQIEWGWNDEEGDPLDQGVYRYQLGWEGPDGSYQSEPQEFSVQKTVRKITIEVTGSPEGLENPADALELRIDK